MNKRDILVDTSFLLPILGVEVEARVIDGLKKVKQSQDRFIIYYSEFSILEAIWKLLKVMSDENVDRVRIGIDTITSNFIKVEPTSKSFICARDLYKKGHKDYIDDLLYCISLENNLEFLTIDEELREFLRKALGENIQVILPEDL